MHLSLVPSPVAADSCRADRPAPFDLAVQATRPGTAHQPVDVHLRAEVAFAVETRAAAAGLAAPPWAAITIEAERAIRQACEATPLRRRQLIQVLDDASRRNGSTPVPAGPAARLLAYAAQLRSAKPRPGADAPSHLALPVPYNCLLGWRHAAAAEGQTVEQWALTVLSSAPPDATLWEAAAAEAGATLAEWTLLQAARACNCSSAAAHWAG
jgi:hypothetical protein